MPTKSEFTPGTLCWAECATDDLAGAREFYSGMFGWSCEEADTGDQGEYVLLKQGAYEVAGLCALQKEQLEHGVPPYWLGYLQVEDADATTRKTAELGGSVILEPMDVLDIGRMSILVDPTGAVFAVWQSGSVKGSGLVGEPGATCWFELATSDAAKAGAFYRELFGFRLDEKDMGIFGKYTVLMAGDEAAAGMLELPAEPAGLPPYWMVYIAVKDCDESAATATRLGGKVCHPPTTIPTIGRFCALTDPRGAAFSIIALAR